MSEPTLQTDWNSEYQFWHTLISEEVERLRFNGGYEPIRVDLYPTQSKNVPAFLGQTQIGHVHFRVLGNWTYDSNGVRTLRLEILKAQ